MSWSGGASTCAPRRHPSMTSAKVRKCGSAKVGVGRALALRPDTSCARQAPPLPASPPNCGGEVTRAGCPVCQRRKDANAGRRSGTEFSPLREERAGRGRGRGPAGASSMPFERRDFSGSRSPSPGAVCRGRGPGGGGPPAQPGAGRSAVIPARPRSVREPSTTFRGTCASYPETRRGLVPYFRTLVPWYDPFVPRRVARGVLGT